MSMTKIKVKVKTEYDHVIFNRDEGGYLCASEYRHGYVPEIYEATKYSEEQAFKIAKDLGNCAIFKCHIHHTYKWIEDKDDRR